MELKLKQHGNSFNPADKLTSDVRNYRLMSTEPIKGKTGKDYTVTVALWPNRKQARTTHKITGKPLKNIAIDLINPEALYVRLEYVDENNNRRIDRLMMELTHDQNYSYTREDILKAINQIAINQYTELVIE